MLGTRDSCNSRVPQCSKMIGGKCCAEFIVEDDSIHSRKTGFAIEVKKDRPCFLESSEKRDVGAGRAIDDPGDFAFEEQLECDFFFGWIFASVADKHAVAICLGRIFDRLYGAGKAGVTDVGDDYADRSGLMGSQGTCRIGWFEFMFMDGGENTFAGLGRHIFGA